MRIAIVSMSTGSGHVRAAKAIESYIKTYTNHVVMHVDAADFIGPILKFFHIWMYEFLSVSMPKAWGVLYKNTNNVEAAKKIKWQNRFQYSITKKLQTKILSHRPDIIICTYFGSAELVKNITTSYHIPTYLVITDYEAHAMFKVNHVSGYFVPTETVQNELISYGAKRNQIYVTGIPIDPTFYIKKNQNELKAKYGINQTEKVLLIIAKTYGKRMVGQILKQVENIPQLSILIIGKQLDLQPHKRIKNIGWTKDIEEYMRISDVVITKSGGLTSTECITLGKYMIILGPIPGQEEANATYIVNSGQGVLCKDIKIIHTLVKVCVSMPHVAVEEKKLDDHPCKKILDIVS